MNPWSNLKRTSAAPSVLLVDAEPYRLAKRMDRGQLRHRMFLYVARAQIERSCRIAVPAVCTGSSNPHIAMMKPNRYRARAKANQ